MFTNIINKRKYVSLFLVVLLFLTSFNLAVYATDIEGYSFDKEVSIKKTDNGFILSYKKVENGKNVFYIETTEDNTVNTKKYNQKGGKLELIEEINSIVEIKEQGTVCVKQINITKDSVETKIVGNLGSKDKEKSVVRTALSLRGKKWHPKHDDYYFVYSETGHLGFRNLSYGVVTTVICTVFTGGTAVAGSIVAGIVNTIIMGGWRDVYFEEKVYYPYGSGHKGEPLWRKIIKYYSDKDRDNQIHKTLYVDSDSVCKI